MNDRESKFEIWVRRRGGADPTYDLKFEVTSGRGLLRAPQTSGVVSTPAGITGQIPDLDAEEVSQSSFIYVDATREHLAFAPDVSQRLHLLSDDKWLICCVNENGLLDMALPTPSLPEQAPAPIAQLRSRQAPASTERKSASEYIMELEDEVALSKQHISALKERISRLEDQVEALGGELTPLVLDARTATKMPQG